jgi:hypothetical protein
MHIPNSIELPGLSAELTERLLATAIARGERARLHRRASAVSMTLLLVIAAAGIRFGGYDAADPTVVFAGVGDAHVIRLVYDSRTDRDDAQVSVTLAGNLEVAGHPGARDLTWSTSLRKGKNVLELPVVLRNTSDAPLNVAFASDSGVKEVRLLVRAVTPALIDASVSQPVSTRRIS